jgi:hypothetical protein
MAEEEENAANQNSEDGVQDTATQTAEDSAQQQADDASATANQNNQDGADKEQEGLKAAAVAEKKKRQEAEAQLQAAQNQNALLQQQMVARQQPNQPESTYAQALREAGLQDEPFITEDQRISVYERKEQLDMQRFQQQQQYAQNAQFVATHPDYAEVAGVDNPVTGQFIPSTELQTILTKKPWLFQAANASAQARYEIVINERALAAYEKTKTVMNEREVRQKADATTSPMSPSATGGGGAAANQFNSAEDVRAMEARIARGEFER